MRMNTTWVNKITTFVKKTDPAGLDPFLGFRSSTRKNGTLIGSLRCPFFCLSVSLSVKTIFSGMRAGIKLKSQKNTRVCNPSELWL